MSVPEVYSEKNVARKANAVIAASYKLSMNEQRVLLAVLGQLKNNEVVTDQKMYFLTPNDIVTDKENRGNEFNALRSACRNLFRREVTIYGIPNKASKIDPSSILTTRWIQSGVVYFEGQAKVGVRISHDILPYINQLRSDFSRIPIKPIMAMTSTHAVRIFEMLMQFRDTGVCRISVKDIKERLDLTDSYPKFSDFRRSVIEFSVKQINETSGIRVSVKYIKSGRSIESIEFKFLKDRLNDCDDSKKAENESYNDGSKRKPRLSEDKKEAMKLLVTEDYDDASSQRVEKIMDSFQINDPVKAVKLLIAKNKRVAG